jgi:hypothetical protein
VWQLIPKFEVSFEVCRHTANKMSASLHYVHAFVSSSILRRHYIHRVLIQFVPILKAVANFPVGSWRGRVAKDFRHD